MSIVLPFIAVGIGLRTKGFWGGWINGISPALYPLKPDPATSPTRRGYPAREIHALNELASYEK